MGLRKALWDWLHNVLRTFEGTLTRHFDQNILKTSVSNGGVAEAAVLLPEASSSPGTTC
jgi:hypothetical protein